MLNKKRVVITGMGCITSIGNNLSDFWNNLKSGEIGIDFIKAFDASTFPIKVSAEVDVENTPALKDEYIKFGYNNKGHFLGYKAAFEACENSGLFKNREVLREAGISLGASSDYPDTDTMAGIAAFSQDNKNWVNNILEHEKKIDQEFINKQYLFSRNASSISSKIAKALKLKGPVYTTQTACASSGNSIGNAYRSILNREADVMLTGGCDAMVTYLWMSAFSHLKALTASKDPLRASIPFDIDRSGFVMGEGAAVIILEELGSAVKRGAAILGELTGYGTSNNAYRITDSPIDGEQTALAIKRAIKDAGIEKEQIDYICTHGTSTIQNDFAESNALKKAFGDTLKNKKINSIKHAVGHTISASGAISSVNAICSINESCIVPMSNIKKVDPECSLNILTEFEHYDINYAQVNAFGFGGQNVCLIFKKYYE